MCWGGEGRHPVYLTLQLTKHEKRAFLKFSIFGEILLFGEILRFYKISC